PYTDVSLGTWTLHVAVPGKAAVDLPVTIDANSTYSVVLLDKKGAFTAQLIRDSAGSSVVPVGGVETGFGGTAPSDPVALLAFGTAAVALGGVFALTLVAGVRRARSR
ncbi:MAG: hypothetical protein QOI16_3137, partial [Pseudonocardiales bacterium]|nr:hypothetical protein [Pseudonocardiales bacterium]